MIPKRERVNDKVFLEYIIIIKYYYYCSATYYTAKQ